MCLFYMPIKVRMLKRAFLEGKLNVRNLELSNTMHKYRNAITFFATFFFQTLKLDSYVTATSNVRIVEHLKYIPDFYEP